MTQLGEYDTVSVMDAGSQYGLVYVETDTVSPAGVHAEMVAPPSPVGTHSPDGVT